MPKIKLVGAAKYKAAGGIVFEKGQIYNLSTDQMKGIPDSDKSLFKTVQEETKVPEAPKGSDKGKVPEAPKEEGSK